MLNPSPHWERHPYFPSRIPAPDFSIIRVPSRTRYLPVYAAIAFDAKSSGTSVAAATLTFAHTVGGGANRLLLVATSDYDGTVNQPTGVTYNGVALTKIGGLASAGNDVATLWGLKNPPSGTFNVVITWAGTPGNGIGGASSWTGVDQTTPWGVAATATAGAGQPSVNVAGTVASSIVVDAFAVDDPTNVALTATGTLLHSIATGANGEGGGSQWKAGGGTITMNWTGATSSWSIVAVEIFAAAAAPAPPVPPLTRTRAAAVEELVRPAVLRDLGIAAPPILARPRSIVAVVEEPVTIWRASVAPFGIAPVIVTVLFRAPRAIVALVEELATPPRAVLAPLVPPPPPPGPDRYHSWVGYARDWPI